MVKQLAKSLGRLATGVGSAAVTAVTDLGRSVTDQQIVTLIEKLADQFEPVTVPVTCRPTGPDVNDFVIEANLHDFEAALAADRYVRPRIEVTAASTDIDRVILTDRLIEKFTMVLTQHEERMSKLRERKRKRLKKEKSETVWALTDITLGFFLDAIVLTIIGLGSLVNPIFWLLIGFGGLGVLVHLPGLTWKLIKESLGYYEGEDQEIHELQRQLQTYRPLLLTMVSEARVIQSAELADQMRMFSSPVQ